MALTFTPMRSTHLADAMRMSAAEGWPHRIEDWALVLEISNGFVALHEDKVVATALATPFGSVAMANLIIVDASMRGQGLGRRIMEQAMATIDPPTWQLVATTDGLPLYENLGFSTRGEISQHQGHVGKIKPIGNAVWGTLGDLPAIKALDCAVLKMDRQVLYDQLSQDARFAVLRDDYSDEFGGDSGDSSGNRKSRISGFAIVREFGRGKVVGPVIANSVDETISLISLILSEHTGQFLRVDTDTQSGLSPWLIQHGLDHVGGGLTMHKGEPICPPTNSQKIFALASQALG